MLFVQGGSSSSYENISFYSFNHSFPAGVSLLTVTAGADPGEVIGNWQGCIISGLTGLFNINVAFVNTSTGMDMVYIDLTVTYV